MQRTGDGAGSGGAPGAENLTVRVRLPWTSNLSLLEVVLWFVCRIEKKKEMEKKKERKMKGERKRRT